MAGRHGTGSRSKAERVDRSLKRRAKMYELIEAHPETYEELQARVKAADIRISKEGNPLGIDGPKPDLHPAIARKIETKERKAAGMTLRRVRTANGSVQEVWTFAASYHAMGFQDHQIHAAERFGRDWEAAYRTLKGQGYEASVDGARSRHGAHFSQVDAQSRLAACQKELGRRAFDIVTAIAIYGATIREIAPRAQVDTRNIRQEVDNAFNDLDAFYTGTRTKDRTWDAIERFNAERAAMIEQAEREVG